MPTRKQTSANPEFRQEAFSSSAEHERGILGNLVAGRCSQIIDPEAIALIWWLQQVSWREGGLNKFAADFLATHQHLIGTKSMHKFGLNPGRVYDAHQVRAVREEFPDGDGCFHGKTLFLLKGEQTMSEVLADSARRSMSYETGNDIVMLRREEYPSCYTSDEFLNECAIDAKSLTRQFKRLLVDPAMNPRDGLWNLPQLFPALCACRQGEIEKAKHGLLETEVTKRVFEELDFALETRSFVLIEGREGIGKSHASVNWSEQHPGQAVYVRLESVTDDTSFFRSIGRALGTAHSYGLKASDLRIRIQDALQAAHLVLLLDEAHFAFPQSDRSHRSAPLRVEWIRTALVDFGVPVVLISTPQYFSRACAKFRKGGWNSLQVQRRLARTAVLPAPEDMPIADIMKIVRHNFPDCNLATQTTIAGLAIGTVGFLTTIIHLRKRLTFLTSRRPGNSASAILAEALRDMGLPDGAKQPAAPAPQAPLKTGLNPALERANFVSAAAPEGTVRRETQPKILAPL